MCVCVSVFVYCPWNSPGQNTGVGSLSLLQGIFPTQGLNPDLPQCRQILYQLSYEGSSRRPLSSVQFSSVAQSRPTLCDPMNRSTPGLPVHHKLPGFTQTHAHWVGDAIQPSHPLLSPFPPAPQPFPASGSFPVSQLFTWGGQSIGVSASASVLPMNAQDLLSPLGWTGWISLQFKGLSSL